MKIFADFHIHGKYARATSKHSTFEGLSENAKSKGLNLLGTGDILHPKWLEEAKEKLTPIGNGIYAYNDINWMVTVEISTMYKQGDKGRAIHHVIHLPSLECAEQLQDWVKTFGKMWKTDGRPIIGSTSPEVVEKVLEIDKDSIIYPAHIWTPWFGALGQDSGFDSLEDCYLDQAKNVKLLETGLSSDPSMNWRVSSLDERTPISSSDPHSPYPYRLGREANCLETELDFNKINKVLITKKGFEFTIEVDPNYGKYHYSGHRKCNVVLSPKEANQLNGICPVCGKPLTIGVSTRIEKLADRKDGYVPNNYVPFKTILPLHEIIANVLDIKGLNSVRVTKEYNKLIQSHGNEFNVLLETPKEELLKTTTEKIANFIIKNREGKIKIRPGFDGVYGQPILE